MITDAQIQKVWKDADGHIATGSSAQWFPINKDFGFKYYCYRFDSFKTARYSRTYRDAKKEFRNTKILSRIYNFVPKPVEVRIVKVKTEGMDDYIVIMILPNLGKTRLMDHSIYYYRQHAVISKFEREFRKKGIYHGDLYECNIMYHKRKYWVIDHEFSYIPMRLRQRYA